MKMWAALIIKWECLEKVIAIWKKKYIMKPVSILIQPVIFGKTQDWASATFFILTKLPSSVQHFLFTKSSPSWVQSQVKSY